MKYGWAGIVVLVVGGFQAASVSGQNIDRGKALYGSRCVVCHGDKGDGKGLVGVVHRAQKTGVIVYTYPRDFTAGVYKFRSTPSGVLPTDADLMRIVTEGIVRSGMPSHTDLSEADRRDLIAYVKTFSPRWQRDAPGQPLQIGAVPAYVGTAPSVSRGAKVYQTMRCGMCHGDKGLGDGPSAPALQDSWGDRIVPFDFTSGPLKGGSSPAMVYRTFMTGLDGTPMPSYEAAMPTEQDRWDLVSFCLNLMRGSRTAP